MSHIIPIIQPMHFLFVSHQSDQPFDATAMTLGQGHGKVIRCILPDPYILCPKYLRCSSNGCDMRGKSRCGSGGRGGRSGNEMKT